MGDLWRAGDDIGLIATTGWTASSAQTALVLPGFTACGKALAIEGSWSRQKIGGRSGLLRRRARAPAIQRARLVGYNEPRPGGDDHLFEPHAGQELASAHLSADAVPVHAMMIEDERWGGWAAASPSRA